MSLNQLIIKIKSCNNLKKFFFIFIIFGFISSTLIGPFWDIFFHLNNGETKLKYLLTFGKYKNFLHQTYAYKYYPGIYDTVSYFILSIFPKSLILELANILSFLVGVFGLIGLKKVCKFLFGRQVSNIFLILSLLSPIYFGHMIMNPKDIVVASCLFWIIYYLYKYFYIEKINKQETSFKIGLLIGLGTGSKIIFAGLLISLIIIITLEFLYLKKTIKKKILLLNIKNIFIIFFTAYTLVILFWAPTHSNILIKPLMLFFEATFKNDLFGVPYSLFANKIIETSNAPWEYLFVNFLFKIPVYVLLLILFLIFNLKKIDLYFASSIKNLKKKISYIFIIIFLPVFLSIILNLKIYDGLRNFIYSIPLINIIAALTIYYIFKNIKKKKIKIFSFVLLINFIYSIFIFFLLTPYQYTYTNYFNRLIYNDYSFENDYLATSTKSLIKKFSKKNLANKKYKIASCANHELIKFYLKKYNISNFELSDDNFDYIVLLNRPLNHEITCMNYFRNNNYEEIVNISRNGVILSSIVKAKTN